MSVREKNQLCAKCLQDGGQKTTCFCFPDTSGNQTPLQQNLNKLGRVLFFNSMHMDMALAFAHLLIFVWLLRSGITRCSGVFMATRPARSCDLVPVCCSPCHACVKRIGETVYIDGVVMLLAFPPLDGQVVVDVPSQCAGARIGVLAIVICVACSMYWVGSFSNLQVIFREVTISCTGRRSCTRLCPPVQHGLQSQVGIFIIGWVTDRKDPSNPESAVPCLLVEGHFGRTAHARAAS